MALPLFFPHPPYAEDQSQAHTILWVHVLHRGFQCGAVLSPLRFYLDRRRERKSLASIAKPATSLSPNAATSSAPIARLSPALPLLLRSAGTVSVYSTAFLGLALVGRMWGREDIEWRDRSWRLLENKGQIECDVFSLAGTVAGLGTWAVGRATGAAVGVGWRAPVGAAALGNVIGVGGYMVWRHGVHRGKFGDEV